MNVCLMSNVQNVIKPTSPPSVHTKCVLPAEWRVNLSPVGNGGDLYFLPPSHVAKESFQHSESKAIWKQLESASVRSHHDTRRCFADFLTMTVCDLSGGQMEDEYLKTVERYSEGEKGNRACDYMANAFGELVNAMEETRADILGDLYMGGVSFGENGQFYTPEHICTLMAQISMPDNSGQRVLDPACGSGRTLLAAADINRHNEFYGVDVDHRCVQMTAINLALRNLYGYVIHGNSLTNETWRAYRTGFNGKGVLKELKIEECPPIVRQAVERSPEPGKQLALF